MLHAIRRHTTHSITFWGCNENNVGGVLGVFIDGTLYTGDTLSSAMNYCGLVTATGLPAGEHTYQMALDGVAVTSAYACKTAPAAGEDVALLFIGDALNTSKQAESLFERAILREAGADAAYANEWVYIDGSEYQVNGATPVATLVSTNNPTGSTSGDSDTDYQAFRNSYRIKQRQSIQHETQRHRFMKRFPMRIVWNNHEFYSATDPFTNPRPGQHHFDGAFRAAYEYEFMGNPLNTDDTDLDTLTLTTGEVVGPTYFREVIGDVEIIMLDVTSYSDDAIALHITDANRGGLYQRTWLEYCIANPMPGTNVTVIMTQSQLDTTKAGSAFWFEEDTGVLAQLNASSRVVILMAANSHTPSARLISYRCPDNPVFEIGMSPFYQTNPSDFTALSGDVLYLKDRSAYKQPWDGVSNGSVNVINADGHKESNWVYGKILRSGTRTTAQLIDAFSGRVRFTVAFEDGGRTPIFETRKVVMASF